MKSISDEDASKKFKIEQSEKLSAMTQNLEIMKKSKENFEKMYNEQTEKSCATSQELERMKNAKEKLEKMYKKQNSKLTDAQDDLKNTLGDLVETKR